MAKILVAYFSATGTTGMAATALADAAGADLPLLPNLVVCGSYDREYIPGELQYAGKEHCALCYVRWIRIREDSGAFGGQCTGSRRDHGRRNAERREEQGRAKGDY